MTQYELMIGDYVLDGDNVAQVTGITCDGIIETTFNETSNIEVIHPIPLTPEILEKNGFVKFIAGQYILPKGDNEWIVNIVPNLSSAPNSNGTMLVAIKNIYTDAKIAISYVHELQHAFRLCGIDKTIEL